MTGVTLAGPRRGPRIAAVMSSRMQPGWADAVQEQPPQIYCPEDLLQAVSLARPVCQFFVQGCGNNPRFRCKKGVRCKLLHPRPNGMGENERNLPHVSVTMVHGKPQISSAWEKSLSGAAVWDSRNRFRKLLNHWFFSPGPGPPRLGVSGRGGALIFAFQRHNAINLFI